MKNLNALSIRITNQNPTYTHSGMFDPSLTCDINLPKKDSIKIESLLLEMFSFTFESSNITLGELIQIHKDKVNLMDKNLNEIQKIINKNKLIEELNTIEIKTYL